MNTESLFTIVLAIAVICIVLGLIKRTFWLCVVAGVLAAILGFSQPEVIANVQESVFSFFDGAIDPMKDDDYMDMVGEENTIPNKGFGDIGMDDND